ncbi:hypothetical protein MAR_015662, partial [Mya arenaria]
MKFSDEMCLIIFTVLFQTLISAQSTSQDSRKLQFISAKFINGEEISRTKLRSRITCFATCGSGCGAAKYFQFSGDCVLYSTFLLLTDDADVKPYGDDVNGYIKVFPKESRYLVVYSGNIGKTWDEAFAICLQYGSGLARILTRQDLASLNATVKQSRVNEETVGCRQRAWLG